MYKKSADGGVIRSSDGANIPAVMENSDWQKYQTWLTEGNKPDPEFTAAELKVNAKAEKEAEARAAFRSRKDKEEWLASPEYAALK